MSRKDTNYATEGTKYHPLFEHLLYNGHGQTTMTFREIEAVLEARLPPSAFSREEWWSNSSNGHSQARSWMRAGYLTSAIDLRARRVTFTLEGWPEGYVRSNFSRKHAASTTSGLADQPQSVVADADDPDKASQGVERDHPLFGIWKGRVTLIPGYDYTKPAFEPDDSAA